jgi:hypothetical protein
MGYLWIRQTPRSISSPVSRCAVGPLRRGVVGRLGKVVCLPFPKKLHCVGCHSLCSGNFLVAEVSLPILLKRTGNVLCVLLPKVHEQWE